MKVFILGGTGFIGRYLTEYYLSKGARVFLLVRNPEKVKTITPSAEIVFGDALRGGEWQKIVPESDFIINLVGETIFKRWTPEYKKLIWDSRILSTRRVVEALTERNVLFNASAVGFYGDGGETELTEESPMGKMYVSELCKAWEEEALKGEELWGKNYYWAFWNCSWKGWGNAFCNFALFKLGLGGRLGSGKQWFPWIHVEDLARAIEFLYEKGEKGIFNLTSPEPIRNIDMTRIIGKVLRRPTPFPVPKFALKLLYGELAEVIMASARVIPKSFLKGVSPLIILPLNLP